MHLAFKEPILECTHKNVEKCHYTYVTQFSPVQEEVCDETFEKSCQITFKQQAVEETVKKCYRPLTKNCNGRGEEVCKTVYESACTTKYVEKKPGEMIFLMLLHIYFSAYYWESFNTKNI